MDLWQLCLQQQEKEPKFVPWVKTDCWVGGCPPDSQAKAFEPAFCESGHGSSGSQALCTDDAPIAEEIISDR